MNDFVTLDEHICKFLKVEDSQPTNSDNLIRLAGGNWRTIDHRMQAMRKSGRIRWHGRKKQNHPPGVRRHGWEVML